MAQKKEFKELDLSNTFLFFGSDGGSGDLPIGIGDDAGICDCTDTGACRTHQSAWEGRYMTFEEFLNDQLEERTKELTEAKNML